MPDPTPTPIVSNTPGAGTPVVAGTVLKQGDTFTDPAGRAGIVNYDVKTGQKLAAGGSTIAPADGGFVSSPTTTTTPNNNNGSLTPNSTNPNNPVTSSTQYGSDVSSLQDTIDNLNKTGAQNAAELQARQAQLQQERIDAINNINSQYASDKATQEGAQKSGYAARATGLVTSGGGFLGNTQSHQGVLQSLQDSYIAQNQALQAKHDAAVQAAQSAYNEKDFQTAQALIANAQDIQKQIIKAKNDFANQQNALATQQREQAVLDQSKLEYNTGQTEKKATAYANLAPADYAKITPDQKAAIDANYYPGYMDAYNKMTQDAASLKSKKDQQALDMQILDARSKIDVGKSFTLGGQTYTGLKTTNATSAQTQAALIQTGHQYFNVNPQTGQPYYLTPKAAASIGLRGDSAIGVPISYRDANGNNLATPAGWKAMENSSGMSHSSFIANFSKYLPTPILDSKGSPTPEYLKTMEAYGLTPKDFKLINGTLTDTSGILANSGQSG